MFEYINKRGRTTKKPEGHSGSMGWIYAKGVKDYIMLTEKKEFTYSEIEEIFDSQAILNYISDIF